MPLFLPKMGNAIHINLKNGADIVDGKTHLVAGILAGIGIVALENKLGIGNNLDKVLLVGGCGIGSLLPDADHPDAPVGKIIPLWIVFKHRTYTHSLFFMIFIVLLGLVLSVNIFLVIGTIIGVFTHLLLDSTTPTGIRWFYPLK